MANLQGNFLESCRDQRERAQIMRMPVALNHLRSYGRDVQAQPAANSLFHFRTEVRRVTYGSGDFAYRHLRGRIAEALLIAFVLGKPVRDLQSECNWLGVNTVGSANLRRVAKLLRSLR